MLLQKHVGHVHHERRLHRLMMKDELRLFEEDHASEQGPTESACDGRTSSSGTLTAASISASRSVVGCMALASASSGPGNSSGRFGGKEEELPNVHVTLEDANPSQVCLQWHCPSRCVDSRKTPAANCLSPVQSALVSYIQAS